MPLSVSPDDIGRLLTHGHVFEAVVDWGLDHSSDYQPDYDWDSWLNALG